MSIKPVSDIVLDVARAANPVRASAAAGRLLSSSPAAAASDDEFPRFVAPGASDGPVGGTAIAWSGARSIAASGPRSDPSAKAYQGLEEFFLQGVVETILPKGEGLFGAGTAGDVWRSMLAEQLAKQIGKAVDLGLTKSESPRNAALKFEAYTQPSTVDSSRRRS